MTVAALCLLVPLLGAAALVSLGPVLPRHAAPLLALAATGAVVALAAVLVGRVDPGPLVLWAGGWRPRDGAAIGISLAVDDAGAAMTTLAAVLTALAIAVSARVVSERSHQFDALMLVFLAGVAGFCLTGDLFDLFVFFELFSVAAYVLVGYQVDERAPLEGSLSFAVTNTAGSILVLFGIGLLYGRTGALNLAQIGVALRGGGPDALLVCAFALLLAGFLVKAAIVPFHFWTADAYAVAPTSVCILLAGVMSELGLFAIARVWWTALEPGLGGHAEAIRTVLVVTGLVSALVGSVMALAQHHLRRMLAFETIAHLGILLVGVGLLSVPALAGVAIFVVGDGLVRAGMFVGVGVLGLRLGSVDEGELHGRGRPLAALGLVFALGALLIAALPPGGAFLGRALIEDDAIKTGHTWAVPAVVLASALSGGALLRAGARVFLGLGDPAPVDPEEAERYARPLERAPALIWVPAAALVVGGLAWGLLPGLVHAAGRAAAAFADPARTAAVVLGGRAGTPLRAVSVPEPGGEAYALAFVSAAGAFAVGALGLWHRRLQIAVPGWAVEAMEALRRAHSGHVGDYLAWLAAGAALLGGVLAAAVL
jgi:multicomponent Na+:H+ antiporter subunit D